MASSFSGLGGLLVGPLASGLSVIVVLLLGNYLADKSFDAAWPVP